MNPIPLVISFRNRRPSEQLALFARRTLQFALDRFAGRLADVTLRVSDENGPRGGVDQHVMLAIKVVGGPDVLLEDQDASPERCVHRVCRRAAQLLGRSLRRRRDQRRR